MARDDLCSWRWASRACSHISIPIALGGDATPHVATQERTLSRGFDRSFKADLYQEMHKVPRVLVFGGSHSPAHGPGHHQAEDRASTAFNFDLPQWPSGGRLGGHGLGARHPTPTKPPAVIWCLQATTLADVPMAPGPHRRRAALAGVSPRRSSTPRWPGP